jgi:hypothetical protein
MLCVYRRALGSKSMNRRQRQISNFEEDWQNWKIIRNLTSIPPSMSQQLPKSIQRHQISKVIRVEKAATIKTTEVTAFPEWMNS